MADKKDELEARRWFRRRLAALGKERPRVKQRRSKERLTEALHHPPEEDTPCPENPQATPEDDQKELDTSTHRSE